LVEGVALPLAEFQLYAADLFAWQPIRAVELTDRFAWQPVRAVGSEARPAWQYVWVAGDPGWQAGVLPP
jgi:hypothetical protein